MPTMMTPDQVRSAYDVAAGSYADTFGNELDGKPLDRKLLELFADRVRDTGEVLEVGAGPGQIGQFLHSLGVQIRHTDLSPEMVAFAQEKNPEVSAEVADMLDLPFDDAAFAGVIGFYAIVHFDGEAVQRSMREMARVMRPGAWLFLSFHMGDEIIRLDEFLGHRVQLEFHKHDPDVVVQAIETAGLNVEEIVKRSPYPDVESPTQRAYVFARR